MKNLANNHYFVAVKGCEMPNKWKLPKGTAKTSIQSAYLILTVQINLKGVIYAKSKMGKYEKPSKKTNSSGL